MTDIRRTRGDTYANEFVLKSKKTGAALNITGYSFLLTVNAKKEPGDADAPEFQVVGTISEAEGGKVAFPLNDAQANRVGLYYYDVQCIDANGGKRTLVKGQYTFTQDITKN